MPSLIRPYALFVTVLTTSPGNAADWTSWGGPYRNFHVESAGFLADSWPPGGPRKLWERTLGEGYSAIAVRGDTLYTMYRRDAAAWQPFRSDQEVVIAMEASTGRTKWEFAYDVRFRSDQGSGPHVMPQLAGNLVFTVGAAGQFHALKAQTGELVWKRDLYQEFGATRLLFGYASHPLFYGDRLIIIAGGKEKAIAALEQKSGHTIWAAHTFRNAYSSPMLVNTGGRDQVIVLSPQQILSIDPTSGKALWVRALGTDPGTAFSSTPLWDQQNQTLVFSHHGGSTALRLNAAGSTFTVEKLWHSSKLRSVFSNLMLVGGWLYMSRGSYGPGFLTSGDIKTGEVRWSARGFANANFLQADGKLIILDEDGWLVLARPKADGSLEILSKARVLSHNAWTVPTLVETTLYLRDRRIITALDVGAKPRAAASRTNRSPLLAERSCQSLQRFAKF